MAENKKPENPFVFPHPAYHVPMSAGMSVINTTELYLGPSSGITLRDHFAGLAMQSLVGTMPEKQVAKESYIYADAMLAEREKEVQP